MDVGTSSELDLWEQRRQDGRRLQRVTEHELRMQQEAEERRLTEQVFWAEIKKHRSALDEKLLKLSVQYEAEFKRHGRLIEELQHKVCTAVPASPLGSQAQPEQGAAQPVETSLLGGWWENAFAWGGSEEASPGRGDEQQPHPAEESAPSAASSPKGRASRTPASSPTGRKSRSPAKRSGTAELRETVARDMSELSHQMTVFARQLEENASKLETVEQCQSQLKILVDEHSTSLAALDAELQIGGIDAPVAELTSPSADRFRSNHERLVQAQNEQFSKLAMLHTDSKDLLVGPGESGGCIDFSFNPAAALTELSASTAGGGGPRHSQPPDCSDAVLEALRGHMEAMAEENNQSISRAVDGLQGSFTAETSVIHDHLESFDNHLELLERRMQTSDNAWQDHLSELGAFRARLEEVAGRCSDRPGGTGEHGGDAQLPDAQGCAAAGPTAHDLRLTELEEHFQQKRRQIDQIRTAQAAELAAIHGKLSAVMQHADDEPPPVSAISMVSNVHLGILGEGSTSSAPATVQSLPTGRDLEEMARHGSAKMLRLDDQQALLEGLQCQFSAELRALERCVEENDEKLTKIQNTVLQGRLEAVVALEDQLKTVEDRLNRTDANLSAAKLEQFCEIAKTQFTSAQLQALERRMEESDGKVGRLLRCQLSASTMMQERFKAMIEAGGEQPDSARAKQAALPADLNGHQPGELDVTFHGRDQLLEISADSFGAGDARERGDAVSGAEPTVFDERLATLEGRLEGMMKMLLQAT